MQGSSAAYEQDLRWLGASPVGRFSVVTSGFGFIHWGHFDVAVSPFALYVATARGRYRAYVRQDDRALPIRGLPGTIRVPGAYEEGDKLCVALEPLIGPTSMRISGMPPELRRYVVGVLGEAPLEVRPRRTRRWELYAYLPIALLGVVLLPAFGGPGDDGGGLFAQVVLAALGAGMLALLPPHMPPLARAVLGPATLGVLAAPVLLLRALPFQTFAFTPFLAAMLLLTGALLGTRFRILAAIPAFFAVLLGIWGAFAIAGSL